MNTEIGKVYIANDDGTYQPLGHIEDAELTPTDTFDGCDYSKIINPISGEFHLTFYYYNNHRKRDGLPLRRGIVNRKFKEFCKTIRGELYV